MDNKKQKVSEILASQDYDRLRAMNRDETSISQNYCQSQDKNLDGDSIVE